MNDRLSLSCTLEVEQEPCLEGVLLKGSEPNVSADEHVLLIRWTLLWRHR
jgi:hypothetical protein